MCVNEIRFVSSPEPRIPKKMTGFYRNRGNSFRYKSLSLSLINPPAALYLFATDTTLPNLTTQIWEATPSTRTARTPHAALLRRSGNGPLTPATSWRPPWRKWIWLAQRRRLQRFRPIGASSVRWLCVRYPNTTNTDNNLPLVVVAPPTTTANRRSATTCRYAYCQTGARLVGLD